MRIVISPATVERDFGGVGKVVDIKVHKEDIIVEREVNRAVFHCRRLIMQKKSFGVEIIE